MEKEELVRRICAGFCSFYKPEKDEDLSCNGFIVLQKLLEKRCEVPAASGQFTVSEETEGLLYESLCLSCPFFDADCDFAAWKSHAKDVETQSPPDPCGGFLFIGHCVDKGTIDIQTINRVI